MSFWVRRHVQARWMQHVPAAVIRSQHFNVFQQSRMALQQFFRVASADPALQPGDAAAAPPPSDAGDRSVLLTPQRQ